MKEIRNFFGTREKSKIKLITMIIIRAITIIIKITIIIIRITTATVSRIIVVL